jgi:two-component system chemotaxis sensor kinase CheA
MNLDPSRYADLFRTESREQLAVINRALLSLESGIDASEPVDEIFRAVHTVKGMSATMGYQAVAEFSHEMESLHDRVRRGEQQLAPELMDALFAAADALEAGIEGASEGAQPSDAMTAVLQRLHDVAGGGSTSEFRAMRMTTGGTVVTTDTAEFEVAATGVLVTVTQSPSTILPGVRAFMVLTKVRELGELAAVHPPEAELKNAPVPMEFTMRLMTQASRALIESTIRSVGEIERVVIDDAHREPASRSTIGMPSVAAPVEEGTIGGATRLTRHVRIDLSRLDTLMNLIGELVITRGRLLQLTATSSDPALDEAMQQASRLIADLQSEIMTSRMVPVWQVFDRFPRLVRDAARQVGKDVQFVVEGKEIELDRSLLDEIGEPIVHLLRNAIDHGIETPEVREAEGKPRAGRLTLSAARDRAAVLIKVSDDGRGIDRNKVLARAKAIGFVDPAVRALDDEQLFRCIAQPGFSTVDKVSGLSGRGVGVDAVLSKARTLGGSVELQTRAFEGTSITIRLPITLAIVRALLARTGGERYALPLTHVRETVAYGPDTVQRIRGKDVLVLRDEVLPLLELSDVVQQPAYARSTGAVGREIVVIERGERRSGLVVDELIGQEDIVVKQFDAPRDGLALFSGATILADGKPALIMDVGSLFQGN